MSDLLKAIGFGLVVLLPLANPLITVAVFLGLSEDMAYDRRLRESRMAALYVFVIMLVAYYGGHLVMHTFGISIPGLRIAGGMIVAFIGFKMLFPQQNAHESTEAQCKSKEREKESGSSIAFVPLAMPTTAGPGTIAVIISTAATTGTGMGFPEWVIWVSPPITFAIVSLLVWLCLKSSGAIMRVLGHSGIESISRLMGFLLVCMGVQFIINGGAEILAH
ncbi:TPA: MarC family NAAT transporter [Enterobacter hormaechei subsp. xiangfangensis]|nr:MarC family NAAT transporter [Enterobacter hormaechei subsp. xiangfangensis]